MKRNTRRNIAREIIDDLEQINEAMRAGVPLLQKFTVRSVRTVPEPSRYSAAAVRATRDLVGVSQAVFAQMLGVSPALVRSWECGQRTPSPLARRMLDLVRASPSEWRAMVDAG